MPEPRKVPLVLDGRHLEAKLWGEIDPNALTFVLLHEGLGSVSLWRDFPARLAEATGCPVFAYSRFGYGQSDAAPLPFPLTYMHDEALSVLPRVLTELGLGHVITLGHSDGASIALIHAGGMQDFRLRGTILIAPHLFVEDISIASIRAARTAYETTDLRQRMMRHHRDPDNAFRGWNDAWLDPRFRDWRIDEFVATVRVPILGIQGEDDEYGTKAQLEALANEALSPVEIHLIAGAKHAPHLTHQEKVLSLIAPFLARIRALESVKMPWGARYHAK
jgi:pimeloyl-ACP methyl ester carboxylesterase